MVKCKTTKSLYPHKKYLVLMEDRKTKEANIIHQLDENVKAGILLTKARNQIMEAYCIVSNKNGSGKVKSQLKDLDECIKLLDNSRSHLDDFMYRTFNEYESKSYLLKKYGYVNGLGDIYYCNGYLKDKEYKHGK